LNMPCMPFVKHVLCKGKPNTQFRTHLMNLLVSLNRQNDGRRVTDRSRSGPVETTAVPVTGTACSPIQWFSPELAVDRWKLLDAAHFVFQVPHGMQSLAR
jgi:hypothetical protein